MIVSIYRSRSASSFSDMITSGEFENKSSVEPLNTVRWAPAAPKEAIISKRHEEMDGNGYGHFMSLENDYHCC